MLPADGDPYIELPDPEPYPEMELLPLISSHTETYYIIRTIVRAVAFVVAIELVIVVCLALSWLIFTLGDALNGAVS